MLKNAKIQKYNFHIKLNNFNIKAVEVTISYSQMKNDQTNWTKSLTLFKVI